MKSVSKRKGYKPLKIQQTKEPVGEDEDKDVNLETEAIKEEKVMDEKEGPSAIDIGAMLEVVIKTEEEEEPNLSKQRTLRPKREKKAIAAPVSTNVEPKAVVKKPKVAVKAKRRPRNNNSSEHDKQIFSCTVCQKIFARKQHLDRHMKMSKCSGLPLPSFPCELCNRVYNRKDNLQEHLRCHAGLSRRKKNHKCPHCEKAFHGQSLLAIHIRKHTGEKPFGCDLCPKRFSSAFVLAKHSVTHTKEQPFSCTECERKFTSKCLLDRHLKTHTDIKPHSCLYCDKTFNQLGALNSHLFNHAVENAIECDDCGKIFHRKTHLRMHQLNVHTKAKPYACEHCPKQFAREDDLMLHSVHHLNEGPFKCPACDLCFHDKPFLKIHLLNHTKERSCPCNECGQNFIGKNCLLCYMKKQHRDVFEKIHFNEKTEKNNIKTSSRLLSKEDLTDNIQELLYLLIGEPTLIDLGWPAKAIDAVLELIIQQCGYPIIQQSYEYTDKLRENIKFLLTGVIGDSSVKMLLNNQTVDEVILHVVRLAKTYNLL